MYRELSSSKSSRLDSHQRHRTSDQGKPGLQSSSDKASASASSLIQILRKTPQTVFSTCLRGLQKGHGDLFHGSKRFLSDILLRSSEADTLSITEADQQRASSSDATDVASSDGSCVAAQVLQSMPEVQQWIKDTVSNLQQGENPFYFAALYAHNLETPSVTVAASSLSRCMTVTVSLMYRSPFQHKRRRDLDPSTAGASSSCTRQDSGANARASCGIPTSTGKTGCAAAPVATCQPICWSR